MPLRWQLLNFEGGFGTYFTQLIADGQSSSLLQWRVLRRSTVRAPWLTVLRRWFLKTAYRLCRLKIGEFDLGRVIVPGGFGTLVCADTQAELSGPGIERNAGGGGDTKVKGLLLASVEFDTKLFESCRVLGPDLPGFDG